MQNTFRACNHTPEGQPPEPVVYDNKEVVPTPVEDVDISKKTAAEWEL